MKVEALKDSVLLEIENRRKAATVGPWESDTDCDVIAPSVLVPALQEESGDDNWLIPYRVASLYYGPKGSQPWADTEFIAHAHEDVGRLLDEVKRLKAEVADLQDARVKTQEKFTEWRNTEFERFIDWRGIERKADVCLPCQGSGIRAYGSTATWRGGAGGQSVTSDVCDKCWGSGNVSKPFASWRKVRQVISAANTAFYRGAVAMRSLAAEFIKHNSHADGLGMGNLRLEEGIRGLGIPTDTSVEAVLSGSRMEKP